MWTIGGQTGRMPDGQGFCWIDQKIIREILAYKTTI
jgi:hypothetical protein